MLSSQDECGVRKAARQLQRSWHPARLGFIFYPDGTLELVIALADDRRAIEAEFAKILNEPRADEP